MENHGALSVGTCCYLLQQVYGEATEHCRTTIGDEVLSTFEAVRAGQDL